MVSIHTSRDNRSTGFGFVYVYLYRKCNYITIKYTVPYCGKNKERSFK